MRKQQQKNKLVLWLALRRYDFSLFHFPKTSELWRTNIGTLQFSLSLSLSVCVCDIFFSPLSHLILLNPYRKRWKSFPIFLLYSQTYNAIPAVIECSVISRKKMAKDERLWHGQLVSNWTLTSRQPHRVGLWHGHAKTESEDTQCPAEAMITVKPCMLSTAPVESEQQTVGWGVGAVAWRCVHGYEM